jgi:hypothetical protein
VDKFDWSLSAWNGFEKLVFNRFDSECTGKIKLTDLALHGPKFDVLEIAHWLCHFYQK